MNRKIFRILPFLICAIPFAAGCGEDSPSAPDAVDSTPLNSPDVIVIPESDDLYLHHFAGDQYILFCRETPRGMEPGRVIAGSGYGGYLRRIRTMQRVGNTLVLDTEQAFLDEVILAGRIEETFTPTLRQFPGASPASGGFNLSGISLYRDLESEESEVVIDSGFFRFDPLIDFSMAVIRGEGISFAATARGQMLYDCLILARLKKELEYSSRYRLVSFYQETILYNDDLPVPVEIELSLEMEVSIDASYYDSCLFGYSEAGTIDIELDYTGGEWSTADRSEFSHTDAVFGAEGYAHGDIEVRMIPSINISFYNEASYAIGSYPLLSASCATETPPVWEWGLFASTCRDISFTGGAISRTIPEFSLSCSTPPNLLGSGPFRTEDFIYISSWGQGETGEPAFFYPFGLAAGSNGDIYVSDNAGHRVSRFSPEGSLINSWGMFGAEDGYFAFPAGLAAGTDGIIYVADSGNKRIQTFDSNGNLIFSWGSEGDGESQFREPSGIATGPDGSVYVSDSYSNRIQKFSPDGHFLLEWGRYGQSPGDFHAPAGVACLSDGTVIVADCRNHRIQKFDAGGLLLAVWGSPGTGEGEFDSPVDAAAGPGDLIYVSDYGNSRIEIFDSNGGFVSEFGREGSGEGEFIHPYGLDFSASGGFYIIDTGNLRVQRFEPID